MWCVCYNTCTVKGLDGRKNTPPSMPDPGHASLGVGWVGHLRGCNSHGRVGPLPGEHPRPAVVPSLGATAMEIRCTQIGQDARVEALAARRLGNHHVNMESSLACGASEVWGLMSGRWRRAKSGALGFTPFAPPPARRETYTAI